MGAPKEIINILRSCHFFSQRYNYIKFLLSKKNTVKVNYDPIKISIVATGRCNFSCDMCPTHSKVIPDDYPYVQETIDDMSYETFKKVVDRFHKALQVHIIGSGEPLLNKDLFGMVDYAAKKKKMKVKTFSNGAAVEENIDKIINSSLDGITISINGHNSKEFSRMTGMEEGWYPKIYQGVKKLVEKRNEAKSKVKVKLSYIIDQQNYKHIPDMIKTSMELGVDITFLCNFLPSPFEDFTAAGRTLMANDGQTVNDLKKIWNGTHEETKRKIAFPVLLDGNRKEAKCKVHFSQIRVDAKGNVGSCSMMLLNMEGQGNFLDKDVWNNDYFQDMRRKFIRNESDMLLGPCKECVDNYGVDHWQ